MNESFESPMSWKGAILQWLPLYRVRGQITYKEGGSPDRGVMSLREGA
jgi:hypothetical protein